MTKAIALTVGALALVGAVVVVKKIKENKDKIEETLCKKCSCEDICGCKSKPSATEGTCGGEAKANEEATAPDVDKVDEVLDNLTACDCDCEHCAAFTAFDEEQTTAEITGVSEEDIEICKESEGEAREPKK